MDLERAAEYLLQVASKHETRIDQQEAWRERDAKEWRKRQEAFDKRQEAFDKRQEAFEKRQVVVEKRLDRLDKLAQEAFVLMRALVRISKECRAENREINRRMDRILKRWDSPNGNGHR
jgi:hypothetical protein